MTNAEMILVLLNLSETATKHNLQPLSAAARDKALILYTEGLLVPFIPDESASEPATTETTDDNA